MAASQDPGAAQPPDRTLNISSLNVLQQNCLRLNRGALPAERNSGLPAETRYALRGFAVFLSGMFPSMREVLAQACERYIEQLPGEPEAAQGARENGQQALLLRPAVVQSVGFCGRDSTAVGWSCGLRTEYSRFAAPPNAEAAAPPRPQYAQHPEAPPENVGFHAKEKPPYDTFDFYGEKRAILAGLTPFTRIDCRNLAECKALDVSGSSVTRLDFGLLSSLEVLNAEGSALDELSGLPSGTLAQIRCINVSKTRITNLDLRGLQRLESLQCDAEPITHLTLKDLPALERLEPPQRCRIIEIASVPLKRLQLSSNETCMLCIEDMKQLVELAFADTDTKPIDGFIKPSFGCFEAHNTGQKALTLSCLDQLCDLDFQGLNTREIVLENYSKLMRVGVGKSMLKLLKICKCASLQRIDAPDCYIAQIHLNDIPQIHLDLSHMRQSAADIQGSSFIDGLILRGADLLQFDTSGLPRLKLLDITNTRLMRIAERYLGELEDLFACGSQLKTLCFSGQHRLRRIRASNATIQVVSLVDMQRLSVVELAACRLSEITAYRLPALEVLDIGQNMGLLQFDFLGLRRLQLLNVGQTGVQMGLCSFASSVRHVNAQCTSLSPQAVADYCRVLQSVALPDGAARVVLAHAGVSYVDTCMAPGVREIVASRADYRAFSLSGGSGAALALLQYGSLQRVDLSSGAVMRLDLRGAGQIRRVVVSPAQAQQMDVANAGEVLFEVSAGGPCEALDAQRLRVSALDVSKLPNLRRCVLPAALTALELTIAQAERVDFDGIERVRCTLTAQAGGPRALRIERSRICSLDLCNAGFIETLVINEVQASVFQLYGTERVICDVRPSEPSLQHLDVYRSNITNFCLNSCYNLQRLLTNSRIRRLEIQHTAITEIALDRLLWLEDLSANQQQFGNIKAQYRPRSRLALFYNTATAISSYQYYGFKAITIFGAQIEEVSILAVKGVTIGLHDLVNLRKLNMRGAVAWDTLQISPGKLEELTISESSSNLNCDNYPALKRLQVSMDTASAAQAGGYGKGSSKTISVRKCGELQEITLRGKCIEALTLGGNAALEHLDIAGTNIKQVDLTDCARLQKFNSCYNCTAINNPLAKK